MELWDNEPQFLNALRKMCRAAAHQFLNINGMSVDDCEQECLTMICRRAQYIRKAADPWNRAWRVAINRLIDLTRLSRNQNELQPTVSPSDVEEHDFDSDIQLEKLANACPNIGKVRWGRKQSAFLEDALYEALQKLPVPQSMMVKMKWGLLRCDTIESELTDDDPVYLPVMTLGDIAQQYACSEDTIQRSLKKCLAALRALLWARMESFEETAEDYVDVHLASNFPTKGQITEPAPDEGSDSGP